MGISHSVGCFEFVLESGDITAGEAVKGSIVLKLKQKVAGKELQLTLKGLETCSLMETDMKVGPIVTMLNRGSKSCFTSITQEVSPLPGGKFLPGDYSFPFSFRTPATLPGSFIYSEQWKKVGISYELTPSISSSRAYLTGKSAVIRITPKAEKTTGQVSMGQQISLLSCGCMCRGSVDVKVICDKVTYEIGETAELEVDIDTSMCQGEIKKIGVGVIYTLHFQRSFGAEHELSRRWVSGRKLKSAHESLRLSIPIRGKPGSFFPFSAVGSKLRSEYFVRVIVLLKNSYMCEGLPEKQITLQVLPKSSIGSTYLESPSISDLDVQREDDRITGEDAFKGLQEKKIDIL